MKTSDPHDLPLFSRWVQQSPPPRPTATTLGNFAEAAIAGPRRAGVIGESGTVGRAGSADSRTHHSQASLHRARQGGDVVYVLRDHVGPVADSQLDNGSIDDVVRLRPAQ